MNKADLGGALVLIVVGLLLLLHRGIRETMVDGMTETQRGWTKILPWLRRSESSLTNEATWRPFVFLAGVVCIVGGLMLLAGASE